MLPPRPLQLKPSFVWTYGLGGTALLLVGVACGVAYGWWQYDAAHELLDQSRIWETGVPAVKASVDSRARSSHFIFHDYDFDVKYVDAGGAQHEQKLKFNTLGGEVDQARDAIVRHLKDDPSRFALSWAIEVKTSRWAGILLFAVVGVGLIGGSFTFFGLGALRRLAAARRCANYSDELIVRITQVVPHVDNGRHTHDNFHYTGETVDGRVVTGKTELPRKHAPLFADPGRQTMVMLVAPEDLARPVAVRDDFHPFLLTLEEQAAVRAAIVARGGTPASSVSGDEEIPANTAPSR